MNNFNLKNKRKQMYSRTRRRNILKKGTLLFVFLIILFSFLLKLLNKKQDSYIEISQLSVEESLFTVCIDAGHGDWDLGASGIYADEKDINLDIALKFGALLEENNEIRVIYTRTDDIISGTTSAESLYSRVKFSNNNNADLFISIHCNSYPDDIYVDGVETWYDPTDINSKYFATLVQKELIDLNYTSDRGVLTYEAGDELYVIENTNATAILVELGFISNPYDEDYLTSVYGQNLCSEALYNATLSYIDSLSKEEGESY